MAWMDVYEEAELRKGRALENLFGPEYGDAFHDAEVDTDPDGWEHRGRSLTRPYMVLHRGDFSAFVVPLDLEYEVFVHGPAGFSTRTSRLPVYTEQEAKDYAVRLMHGAMVRALDGAAS